MKAVSNVTYLCEVLGFQRRMDQRGLNFFSTRREKGEGTHTHTHTHTHESKGKSLRAGPGKR